MTTHPADLFERYYTEKLWEMLPGVYRYEDALGSNPGVLRSLVEIIARQAATVRRSSDRLWDDQFIDLCDSWAVPYIGELLGTRPLAALNKRGRRADVAKTIYYRRRAGTLRVLEELIADITGWEGVVTESFRRLGRILHNLDTCGGAAGGTFWADLRNPAIAESGATSFDALQHTADVRKARGGDGSYGIPKLLLHIYRVQSLPVIRSFPKKMSDGTTFTFDPTGRDVPLYAGSGPGAGYDEWRRRDPWEIAAPVSCRLFDHAEYELTVATVARLTSEHSLPPTARGELMILCGERFADEARLRQVLGSLQSSAELLDDAVWHDLLKYTLIDRCGKAALLPGSFSFEKSRVVAAVERTKAACLQPWRSLPQGTTLLIDPQRGRGRVAEEIDYLTDRVSYRYGSALPVGAGTYDRGASIGAIVPEVVRVFESRTLVVPDGPDTVHTLATPEQRSTLSSQDIKNRGVLLIDDSATYCPVADKLKVKNLTIVAANNRRPLLRLQDAPDTNVGTNWVLNTGSETDATVMLDGLWLCACKNEKVILRGDFETVIIRHCTFDPGGVDAEGMVIPPLKLLVEGHIETMIIERSIMGPIETAAAGVIEELRIDDSILHTVDTALPVLKTTSGVVRMNRVTVLGSMAVYALYASEVLAAGVVDVFDTNNGCFRFGAAAQPSRLPHAYESYRYERFEGFFTSTVFGHPGYAQLAENVPREVRRGGENGDEIGVFNRWIPRTKVDSLSAKIEEYTPFGMIPVFCFET